MDVQKEMEGNLQCSVGQNNPVYMNNYQRLQEQDTFQFVLVGYTD